MGMRLPFIGNLIATANSTSRQLHGNKINLEKGKTADINRKFADNK